MSPRRITPHDEALGALLYITAFWGGWMPIRLGSDGPRASFWRQGPGWAPGRLRVRWDLPGLVRYLDEQHDDEILLRLPLNEPWENGVGIGSVLWVRVTGPEQLKRARAFRPLPSLVLQEGGASQRLLFWALERPVNWLRLKDQNRRIAYKFGARQRDGDPDELVFCAPGTCLREGRARPAPVTCARLTTASFDVGVFERHRALRDPPPKDAWMTGATR